MGAKYRQDFSVLSCKCKINLGKYLSLKYPPPNEHLISKTHLHPWLITCQLLRLCYDSPSAVISKSHETGVLISQKMTTPVP